MNDLPLPANDQHDHAGAAKDTSPLPARRIGEADLARRDEEIARLRHEISRLRGSRTWRHGRVLQHLLSLPGLPHLLLGRPLWLKPLREVEVAPAGKTGQTWHFLGGDPQIDVSWSRRWPLPSGHYEFRIDVVDAPADWQAEMHLYADSGNGYNESEKVRLALTPIGQGRYRARFALHHLTEQLRLDPAEMEGRLTLGRARLRRMTRTEYYGRAILRVIEAHRRTGRPLSQLFRSGWQRLRSGGVRGVAAALRGQSTSSDLGADYASWIARYDTLTEPMLEQLRTKVAALADQPKIAVLMPVYNTPERLLREAIESVLGQVYENWELCIANDCSTARHIAPVLDEYARRDARIRVIHRAENGHISRASNSALEMVTADWVALLDHDDLLRPHALAEVALELSRHPDAELLYSDEDKLSEGGVRFDPNFKPDFSRELFRSQNYLNHLTVHRTANIRAVGGWRVGFEGSQDYDLNLRICERIGFRNIRHIPKVLYHWRAVTGSTALDSGQKNYAYRAGFKALKEHVQRMALPATVEEVADTPFYRLHFAVPLDQPLVSLIVPTRDRVDLLSRAISSIREKTTYRNYEIIVVDNGSIDPETLAYLDELAASGAGRVLRYDEPFNYSAINNFAVGQASGSIVGLVNNDVEVISPNWLTEMVSWAIQPEVGCVGAKLYYPNDTIQHAGVVLGVGGVANHAYLAYDRAALGHFGRARVHNNWSAVTGACLLVRRSLYLKVGGLDAENLPIAFNDIDFCIKVRSCGVANVWTPFAELYHHESVSRGADDTPEKQERFLREANYMLSKWAPTLDTDPYYSVNYSKAMPAFTLPR